MQRFEPLHSETSPRRSRRPARQETSESRLPSRRASPCLQRSPHRQSALNADALQGVSLPSTAHPLALDPRAAAHQLTRSARIAFPVPLGAAKQSHQLAPPPLTRFVRAPPASLEPLVPRASFEFAPPALPALSTNSAESSQSGLLIAPLALVSLSVASLPSHLQYGLQYLHTESRVASTGVVPAALQSGTTSALYAPAPLLFEAAAVQPALQVGDQFASAHPSQIEAPLSMAAKPVQV